MGENQPTPRKRRALRWVLWLGLLAVIALLCLWGVRYYMSGVTVTFGYDIEARFTQLPEDDTALEQWLSDQPKVVGLPTVERDATGRVHVYFLMVRNFRGEPPFPDLDGACKTLGYSGQIYGFRDVTPREH